jgi:hypothetical protein
MDGCIMSWWDILKNAKISGKAKGKGTSFDASKIKINIDKDDCNKKLEQWAKNAKKVPLILPNLYSNNKWFRENFRKNLNTIFTASFLFKKYEADSRYDMESDVFNIREDITGVYNTIPEKVACKAISQFNSSSDFEESEFMGYTIKTWREKNGNNIEVWVDGDTTVIEIGHYRHRGAIRQEYYPNANDMDIIDDLIEWDKELPKWWV